MRASALAVAIVLLSGCGGGSTPSSTPLPLHKVADVVLPGGQTRFDYQDIDPASRRLFVAHLGDGTVDVIDLDRFTVDTVLRGVDSAHGVRVAPAVGRLYVSATGTHQLATFDLTTLHPAGRTSAGDYPDGIAYDPAESTVWVSDESGGIETVADAHTGAAIGTVALGGEAGNVAYDRETGQVLVDVQTRDQLVAIDPTTRQVTWRADLPGCDHDHGLQLDGSGQKAYVACDGNAKLLVVDVASRSVTQHFNVGSEPDVLALDPGLGVLYVAAESGVVAVFRQTPGGLTKLGQGFLADNAHTVAVDPVTHHVFFALPSVDDRPVVRVMRPTVGVR